jgi:hypothetical protein
MTVLLRAIDDVDPGVTFTPEGYARVWLRIVDPTKVYDYGTHTAEVPVQTAIDPVALSTLIGKPVTMDHPSEWVGPDTIRHLRHGTVLSCEVVGSEPYAQVQAETPELLAYGRRNGWRLTCSPGYDFREAPSEVADFAQVDRQYNHLAICVSTQPRGGSRCRTILTATDGIAVEGASLEREQLIALLMSKGVAEADAPALVDEIMSMKKPEIEVEVGADMKPEDMAMDAKVKASLAAARDAVAKAQKDAAAKVKAAQDAANAAIAAANKRAQDAEIARAGVSVRRAADSLQIGKDASDVVKIAEQIADKCGVPHKGMDAVAFAEGVGYRAQSAKSTDGWKLDAVDPKGKGGKSTDSADSDEPTLSSMEC